MYRVEGELDRSLALEERDERGQVPVMVGIRDVEFFTALFPKGGVYLLPLKAAVRKRLGATAGDLIVGALRVGRV